LESVIPHVLALMGTISKEREIMPNVTTRMNVRVHLHAVTTPSARIQLDPTRVLVTTATLRIGPVPPLLVQIQTNVQTAHTTAPQMAARNAKIRKVPSLVCAKLDTSRREDHVTRSPSPSGNPGTNARKRALQVNDRALEHV
jgi:hypothetical protein